LSTTSTLRWFFEHESWHGQACNNYKLFSGKAAEADLKALEETLKGPTENELVKHNHVVFRSGENALQV
jgi:intraflagellar transport protein 56